MANFTRNLEMFQGITKCPYPFFGQGGQNAGLVKNTKNILVVFFYWDMVIQSNNPNQRSFCCFALLISKYSVKQSKAHFKQIHLF